MKKIQITPDIAITDISQGLGGLGVFSREEECFRVLDRYRELGGNCIDTARRYQGGETDRVVGKYLKSRNCRNEIIICGKGCMPDHPKAPNLLTPAGIRRELEESLRALELDYVDLFLLHRDDPDVPVEEIMPVLDGLIREGKVRAVGCSNWTAGRIEEANRFARGEGFALFAVSQIFFSLAQTTPARSGDVTHIMMNEVEYGWYREADFPLIAYSAQAKGYFARFAAGREQKPSPAKYFDFIPENGRRAKRLMELAEQLNTNVSALALAYVRDRGLRVSALCAYSEGRQQEDSMEALHITLTPAQIRWLETGE